MSIFNEANRAKRLAIMQERQAALQRIQQQEQTLVAQERERQRQITLFRQFPIAQALAHVNETYWHGKGRIRDYTHNYPVDHAAGHVISPGEPIMVLEAGRRQRVAYTEFYYRRADIPKDSITKSPTLPFVVPYNQVYKSKEREKTQTEPVLLVASLKTVPFGAGSRDVIQLALGYGFEATQAFQKTTDVDTRDPQHSRSITFYWSTEIPLFYPLTIDALSRQLNVALAAGIRQVDPHREIFNHLVPLPEQPIGQRTPPPRYGAPIRKGSHI